jgi:hypothetical protein
MQLLVAVEERRTRIIRDEIEFDFLESTQHDDVLEHSRGGPAADARQFKAMPVQVKRVDVVAGLPRHRRR